jgi:hypothetical protein
MKLNKKEIQEFQNIYKKEFGKEIDEATAYKTARQLLGFFELLYKVNDKHESRKKYN